MTTPSAARLYVLAGVNGGGKSSIAGAMFRTSGADYYNADEIARRLKDANHKLSQFEANSAAWQQGMRLLERAIADKLDFAFETTLGGNTVPRMLSEAAEKGGQVYVWYVGLNSPELHIRRVRARVRRGGHNISDADIRRRYDHSRMNLVHLLPAVTAVRVYDNSIEADPTLGKLPAPKLVLHMENKKILAPEDLSQTPAWAKPIVAAAIKLAK